MNQAALVGLLLGAVLGGGYSWWQGRAWRQTAALAERGAPFPLWAQAGRAGLRLLTLAIVLVLLLQAPSDVIDRWWLTGGFAGAYTVWLFWKLRRVRFRGR